MAAIPFFWPLHGKTDFNNLPNALSLAPPASSSSLNQVQLGFHPRFHCYHSPLRSPKPSLTAHSPHSSDSNRINDALFEIVCWTDSEFSNWSGRCERLEVGSFVLSATFREAVAHFSGIIDQNLDGRRYMTNHSCEYSSDIAARPF